MSEPAIPLRLRHRTGASAPTAAWLLIGDNAAQWLDAIASWGVPLASVRLLPLPASPRTRDVVGVLAVADDARSIRVGPRALPYARLADRLFIPADAELWPPVSDVELPTLCPWPAAVFHPSIGLVAFDERDIMRAIDLLVAPPPRETTWDGAIAAPFATPRVRQVLAESPPASLGDVLSLGRDDIGAASPTELPPTDDESAATRVGKRAQLGVSNMIKKLTSGASASSAAGKLGAWAERRAAQLKEQLDAARNRELARLMKLLERDPDRGLRYALPLNAPPSTRGEVEAGARLGPRDVGFDLGRLFGSRPAAAWSTPFEAQQKLAARYRELAQRELSLGRHRRAAYVFAELLGDFHNAAAALEQGRFFREAAVLYRDKLNNLTGAATCLERGGLLQEAATMYESAGQFEKAGDLHRTLDASDEAERLYRAAVDAHRGRQDALAASRILEAKLGDADAALEQLSAAWEENQRQAELCLREGFATLARLGRHGDAERALRELRANAAGEKRPLAVAGVLAEVARDATARPTRALAEDAARVVAGHALAGSAHVTDRDALLAIVARTQADDRLLFRDTTRFRDANPKRPPPMPALPRGAAKVELVRRFQLEGDDEDVRWRTMAAVEGGFLAVGTHYDDTLVVARGTWMQMTQAVHCTFPDAGDLEFRLAVAGRAAILAPIGTPRRPAAPIALPPAGAFPMLLLSRSNVLRPGSIYGIAGGEDETFHVLYRPPDAFDAAPLLLDHVRGDGRLISTITTTIANIGDAWPGSIFLAAHGEHVLVTFANELRWYTRGTQQRTIPLPGPAAGLSVSPRQTALRAAIPTAIVEGTPGVAVVWPQHNAVATAGASLGATAALLTGDGTLAGFADKRCATATFADRRLAKFADAPFEAGAPVAAIATGVASQVAVLYKNGKIAVANAG